MQVDRDGGSVAWNWRVCCLSTVNSVGMWEVGGGRRRFRPGSPWRGYAATVNGYAGSGESCCGTSSASSNHRSIRRAGVGGRTEAAHRLVISTLAEDLVPVLASGRDHSHLPNNWLLCLGADHILISPRQRKHSTAALRHFPAHPQPSAASHYVQLLAPGPTEHPGLTSEMDERWAVYPAPVGRGNSI